MEKQWKAKNPFEKAVVDEGWEVVEIKSGVKQIKIERNTGEKNGEPKDNRDVSKQRS